MANEIGKRNKERLIELDMTPDEIKAKGAEIKAKYGPRPVKKGSTEPFYFYDPWETQPKFSNDPTGASPYGRYIVRFAGAWEQSASFTRADIEIELIEIA